MSDLTSVLAELERGPAATGADIGALRAFRAWLPADYIACLQYSDGLEGYVGGRGYLRLWSTQTALYFNAAYRVQDFLPSVFLFGTDAASIGYGFDQRHPVRAFSIELAAMDDEYLTEVASSFTAFILSLASSESSADVVADHHPPTWLRGHVLHEKHPVVLGGPVNDPSNRVLVPEDQHPELAVFFTRTLRAVRVRTQEGQ